VSNTKKHITFCSTSFFEYDRRIQRITHVLTKNGYTINWISRSYNRISKDKHEINHHILRTFFKNGILFYFEFNLKLFLKILFSKTDIICSIDNDTIIPCYYAALFRNKNIVFDAHEIFHEVPELINKPLKKRIWKKISSIYYPKIKSKYTVNKSLQQFFLKEFDTDFKVIRNVPNLSNLNGTSPKLKYKTLVYLGVLNKGRGIELAIESLVYLTDYKLKLIGEGDITDSLKALSKKLNLDSRVEFLGYLKPSLINKELSGSSIGLNLLISESENYKLSLANKFFDYIHIGLPSINMDYPEYQNINRTHKVAILVNEYSSLKLVDAVHKLEKQDTYTFLQNNCLNARNEFNWDIESQKLIEIFSLLTA